MRPPFSSPDLHGKQSLIDDLHVQIQFGQDVKDRRGTHKSCWIAEKPLDDDQWTGELGGGIDIQDLDTASWGEHPCRLLEHPIGLQRMVESIHEHHESRGATSNGKGLANPQYFIAFRPPGCFPQKCNLRIHVYIVARQITA